jgi:hypothetical protein
MLGVCFLIKGAFRDREGHEMDWDFVNLHGTSRSKKEQVFKFFRCYQIQKIIFFTCVADPGSGIRCLFDPWIRDP